MPSIELKFDGHKINVTHATAYSPQVEQILCDFQSSTAHESSCIGLGVEFGLPSYPKKQEVGNLYLCDGKQCIVFEMDCGMQSMLMSFLRGADATFVGMGIKQSLKRLVKNYGIWCRNVVELGEIAARTRNSTTLAYYGVYELAFKILEPNPEKSKEEFFADLQAGFGHLNNGENHVLQCLDVLEDSVCIGL